MLKQQWTKNSTKISPVRTSTAAERAFHHNTWIHFSLAKVYELFQKTISCPWYMNAYPLVWTGVCEMRQREGVTGAVGCVGREKAVFFGRPLSGRATDRNCGASARCSP
ncbi:hypothetical protein CDAR_119521 [Caerostris darwini]|uniref:Uncharacterized protein n=1 Tax=Caerostris darwini TaxID=1538125 RepID=A0AAV4SE64_9ARAC|nr:hypothetical protein CDAR_119521 [Caerostris darwini]